MFERPNTRQEGEVSVGDILELGAGLLGLKGLWDGNKNNFKGIAKETVSNIKSNPVSFQDILEGGLTDVVRVVTGHESKMIEEQMQIKNKTLKSMTDLEAEEQRLVALRQMLEQQEAVLKAQRERLAKSGARDVLTEEDLVRYRVQVDSTRAKKQEGAKDKVVSFGDKLGAQLTED